MTQDWLLPIDGSATSLRAVDWAIAAATAMRNAPALHVVNVQPALPQDVSRFIDANTVRAFHAESGTQALAEAVARLKASGLDHHAHVLVGEAAPAIVDFAQAHACGQIVMGTQGHSGITGLLMGSVAMRVINLATLPVVLIK